MAVRYAALSACRKVRMPSVRAEKYIRDASGWGKDVTDGNDNGTDGQTDRQTDRVRRNMRPPPREDGRIITKNEKLLSREVRSSIVREGNPVRYRMHKNWRWVDNQDSKQQPYYDWRLQSAVMRRIFAKYSQTLYVCAAGRMFYTVYWRVPACVSQRGLLYGKCLWTSVAT